MDLAQEALLLHHQNPGKIGTLVLTPIKDKHDLSLAYTPGVAAVSQAVAADPRLAYDYTGKGHTVAIVTDGSAVLGLGNIGPEAALPVMEGKAAIFKTFANLDAVTICLATQDTSEIIRTVKLLAPVFGGINLEDISAPRCFAVEAGLQDLGIPVMHDDQHGTATVVTAGLINAAAVAGKTMTDLKIVISGAGAAGHAIASMLAPKVARVVVLDSKGIIGSHRSDLDPYKLQLLELTNPDNLSGGLPEALADADVFIGVSKPGVFHPDYVKLMADRPIIFALANPIPEIMPDEARAAGAFIVATGRSDFPNQINNSLAFPGIFKGALEARATRITDAMTQAAALAIAGMVDHPDVNHIIPDPFTPELTLRVAAAVKSACL